MRLAYRVSQFVQALTSRPDETAYEPARLALTPPLFELFLQMSPAEQGHSLRVFHWLRQRGARDPDLLAAALLHDVGKSRVRMMLWERVLVALSGPWLKVAPSNNGNGRLRSFEVALKHPAWGAEMVGRAGGSRQLQALIADHQSTPPPASGDERDLLRELQAADGVN